MNGKTIKSIDTFRYKVDLIETINDTYIIKHESKVYGLPSKSEEIHNFKTASFLFDVKVDELEGN